MKFQLLTVSLALIVMFTIAQPSYSEENTCPFWIDGVQLEFIGSGDMPNVDLNVNGNTRVHPWNGLLLVGGDEKPADNPIDTSVSLAFSTGPSTGPPPFPVLGPIEAPQSVTVSGDTECPECAARAEGDHFSCATRIIKNVAIDLPPCLLKAAVGFGKSLFGGGAGVGAGVIGELWGIGKSVVAKSGAFMESTASGVANAGGT